MYLKSDGKDPLGPYKVRPGGDRTVSFKRCANQSFTFSIQSVNGGTIKGEYEWKTSEYRLKD